MSAVARGVSRQRGPAAEEFFRLSLGQYHEMIGAGLLVDARVELLDGWLIAKMPNNPPHSIATDAVFKWLLRNLPPGWDAISQLPVTLETSEPEPDAAVIRCR